MAKGSYEVWCQACGCLMKLRDGKYGQFYGCTGYPQCRNTMKVRDAELQVMNDPDNDEVAMYRYDRDD